MLQKQVDFAHWVGGIPKGEYRHRFVASPLCAQGRVGECLCGDRCAGPRPMATRAPTTASDASRERSTTTSRSAVNRACPWRTVATPPTTTYPAPDSLSARKRGSNNATGASYHDEEARRLDQRASWVASEDLINRRSGGGFPTPCRERPTRGAGPDAGPRRPPGRWAPG